MDGMNNAPKKPSGMGLRTSGRICFLAAFVLYVVAWILVYLIQESQLFGPGRDAFGLIAYFCSVLPFGPAFLCLIGVVLLIVHSLTARPTTGE